MHPSRERANISRANGSHPGAFLFFSNRLAAVYCAEFHFSVTLIRAGLSWPALTAERCMIILHHLPPERRGRHRTIRRFSSSSSSSSSTATLGTMSGCRCCWQASKSCEPDHRRIPEADPGLAETKANRNRIKFTLGTKQSNIPSRRLTGYITRI